jgi:hypothetical protein
MKYKTFNDVPAKALAGAQKDLLTKLSNGTILFEEFTGYLNAPKEVRLQITQLLNLDIPQTIEGKLMSFGNLARSRGLSLKIDPDIVNRLTAVVTNPIPQGKWRWIDNKNGTTEGEMFKTAQKMCLSNAVDVLTKELQNGVFNKYGTHRIIFIKEDSEGVSLKICCQRYNDNQLSLFIFNVYPDNVWDGDPDNIFHGADIEWFEKQ